jgi:hypothetical protein
VIVPDVNKRFDTTKYLYWSLPLSQTHMPLVQRRQKLYTVIVNINSEKQDEGWIKCMGKRDIAGVIYARKSQPLALRITKRS